jgi:hypothetical protein
MGASPFPLPYITPDASIGASFGTPSNSVALPGTPSADRQVLITNLGSCHLAVALGTSSAVTVTPSTGLVIMAGRSLAIGLTGQTWLAGVSCGGPGTNTQVNITTGN